MKFDTRYGKITDGVFSYAPRSINGTANPSDIDIIAAGYLPVRVEMPSPKLGVEYIPSGWEERDGAIYRTFTETPIVSPATVYIVEEIIYQLIAEDKLQGTKAVVGDFWDLFTMREKISDDNKYWQILFPQVCDGLIEQQVFQNQQEIDDLLMKCREGYIEEDLVNSEEAEETAE